MKSVLAWHFLREDSRLRYGDGRIVKVGRRMCAPAGKLDVCRYGMHASENLLDALKYAPGPIVCRVELSGNIIKAGDKLVARYRKVIAMADASKELRLFTCWVASRTLKQAGITDPRAWKAIQTSRRFAHGKATLSELSTTWDAARAATWTATWTADLDDTWVRAWDAARAATWTATKLQKANLTKRINKLLELE